MPRPKRTQTVHSTTCTGVARGRWQWRTGLLRWRWAQTARELSLAHTPGWQVMYTAPTLAEAVAFSWGYCSGRLP